MTPNTGLPLRLECALKHVLGDSVLTMKREDWHTMISTPSDVSLVRTLPSPFSQLATQVNSLVVTAVGFGTPEARVDVYRGDEKDYPYIWNKDPYTIIQTLCDHPQYERILKTAGVPEDPILHEYLAAHVFVVKHGPKDSEGHWLQELPSIVRDLLHREAPPVNP